jgi:hypothetical protein
MKISKRFRKNWLIYFSLIVTILFPCIIASNITTQMNITNGPPVLLQPIPNWSWKPNSNLVNAFDLDTYFIDDDGMPVASYNYSSIDNITVIINGNNSVSFYPDFNFTGNRTIIFYASDNFFTTPSNIVQLYVGGDTEPPKWYSPTKDKAIVYQNDYVNFTTRWTDDYSLMNFTFSIRLLDVWTNYSQDFSGALNYSRYRVQISNPEFSMVYWYLDPIS